MAPSNLGDWTGLLAPFAYQSSQVDWCEPNYVHSPYVAEFFNTISSIPICLAGALHVGSYELFARQFDLRVRILAYFVICVGLGSIWFHMTLSIPICLAGALHVGSYELFARQFDLRVRILAYFVICVGFGSIWFHMTLSTIGQLADELFILWLLALGQAWYFPIAILPDNAKVKRSHLAVFFCSLALISTCLCHTYPVVNHFALCAISLPQYTGMTIAYFTRKSPPPQMLTHMYYGCMGVWILAFLVWIADQTICTTLLAWNIPYLHATWHILSSIGCCHSLNLSVYLDLESSSKFNQMTIKLRKFPQNLGYFSYQYLSIS